MTSTDKIRDAVREGIREAREVEQREPLSYADVEGMTQAEINADWERVSAVLAKGPTPPEEETDDDA